MAKSSSGRGYSRRYRSSGNSGSRSSGQCKGNTTKCVLIPICCVVGFLFLLGMFSLLIICCKKANKKYQEILEQKAKDKKYQQQELKYNKIAEASKLNKLQKDQEDRVKNNLYMNQTNYSINHQQNNKFVVPGAPIQPVSQEAFPQPGINNYQPVPLIYDPEAYGLIYDNNETAPLQQFAPDLQIGRNEGDTKEIDPNIGKTNKVAPI
ncbi:unnamed protein product [Moneuplotes crassus]|uniref:Transmembrane protein n=1 Tax=Euplotes crassus TaxID=5936 RepID=A0AAD1UP45_EUPCR|nr:unnamed protein product [Moneuplotes crassus]